MKFAASVQRILTQNRSFQDEVLEILSTSMANVNSQLQGISCIINSLAAAMIYQNVLRQSQAKIESLLFPLTQGQLEAQVEQILDLEDIESIVQNSKQLNGTIFTSYPELLFRVGKMVVIDFTEEENNYNFHFVLANPNLKANTMHQMYEVLHVPIIRKMPKTRLV